MIKNILVRRGGGNIKLKFLIFAVIIFSAFILRASISFAATEVFFDKVVTEVKKGDTFTVNLKISSDKIINVVDGTITYDKDILAIESINKNDSFLSLWVKEPVFNNDTGELSFIGGIPNGLLIKDGEILNITFLAKKEGQTLLGFKDIFSVYANDGLGTNLNPWLEPMSLTVNKKPDSLARVESGEKSSWYYTGGVILILLFAIIGLLIKKRYVK